MSNEQYKEKYEPLIEHGREVNMNWADASDR